MATSIALGFISTGHAQEVTEDTKADVEVISVKGVRGSSIRSIYNKRNAASVIESISAEDIGKLPDITIADSLQRVTGVQISRSAGEGAQVNVRGLSQVTTLLNGEQFISAGSITGLQPDYGDVPAELLGGVEVYKSAESKLMSSGISGTINLKSRRPLDLEDDGFTVLASGEVSNGNYTEEDGQKAVLFTGYKGDDFGVIITATHSDATLANFRYGMMSDYVYRSFREDLDGDGEIDAFLGNIDYGITNKKAMRERTGASLSFQYNISDDLEFVGDVFYTEMENNDLLNGLVVDNAWSKWSNFIQPIDLTSRGNEGNVDEGYEGEQYFTTNYFNVHAPRVMSKGEAVSSERDSLNANIQFNFMLGDQFSGALRFIHGEAYSHTTNNYADAFVTSGAQQNLYSKVDGVQEVVNPGGWGPEDIVVEVDMRGQHPTMVFPEGFGNDLSQYALVSTFSERNSENEAKLDALRFDGKYEFEDSYGFIDTLELEFGARYAKREVESLAYDLAAPFTRKLNDNSGEIVTAYAKWKDAGLSIDGGSGDTIGRYVGYEELDSLGYITQVSDFGPASDGSTFYFIDPQTMANAMEFQNAIYDGNVRAPRWFSSYKVAETSSTFYLQTNFTGEIGLPFRANIGVQGVGSEIDVTNYAGGNSGNSYLVVDDIRYNSIAGTPGPRTGTIVTTKRTMDFLPRANFTFDLSDDFVMRLSYTENLTQLDASRLGQGEEVTMTAYGTEELQGVFQAQRLTRNGSPLLEPWKSKNLDLSFEWYFNDEGIMSLGLYKLDIESFPTTVNTEVEGVADSDGVIRNNGIPANYWVNGDGAGLQGVEIGYNQAFDFLPGAWSGLGSTVNYTWADGEGGSRDYYGKELIMPGISEHQFNAILWYQYGDLQARIAYNYRSERFNGTIGADGHNLAYMTSPTKFVDISVNYQLTENIELYAQGQNVTEEYESTYMQWADVTTNQNVFESRYTLGIRARF
ncbi:TonB-dependent receptor [Glaciecola sp. 2405UD65-10]|uniref:TonB-dependent receptor n=1 Tax=Glaciecola sp. 2405UD65-10 TaxID=3397244 RepID=UPI003B5AB95C